MYKVVLRNSNREKRRLRVRKKIFGTAKIPRLSVFKSLKYVYAQLIDDSKGMTLVDVSDVVKKEHKNKTKTEAAYELGKILAKKAVKEKIKKVVFDRNGYIYHGRIKRLAEGMREGGLEF